MHAEAVEAFLAANGMAPSAIAVVGFHGQTVLHRPDRGLTVQIGDGAALAARLGIPVVYDFRAADVAAGGQGAPLVPVFHRALVRMLKRPHPVAVLNIGGVANVTFIDGDADLDRLRHRARQCADRRLHARAHRAAAGRRRRTAAAGKVDEDAVARVLAHPFFAQAAAEIARPQRLPPLGDGGGDGSPTRAPRMARRRSRRSPRRRWRTRPHAAARAGELDRRRRRRAQSDPDADAGASGWRRPASRPRARSAGRPMRSRRRPSPISRCARSRACRSPFPRPPACRGRSPAGCWCENQTGLGFARA